MNVALGIVLLATGVMLLVMGVLGGIGRLPRNALVGYRLPRLMASDAAWHRGHRAATLPTVAAGAVVMIGAVPVMLAPTEEAVALWTLASVLMMLGLVGLGLILAMLAARSH